MTPPKPRQTVFYWLGMKYNYVEQTPSEVTKCSTLKICDFTCWRVEVVLCSNMSKGRLIVLNDLPFKKEGKTVLRKGNCIIWPSILHGWNNCVMLYWMQNRQMAALLLGSFQLFRLKLQSVLHLIFVILHVEGKSWTLFYLVKRKVNSNQWPSLQNGMKNCVKEGKLYHKTFHSKRRAQLCFALVCKTGKWVLSYFGPFICFQIRAIVLEEVLATHITNPLCIYN